jgi:hypothetical protein
MDVFAVFVHSHEIHFLWRGSFDCAQIEGNQALKPCPIRDSRLRRCAIIEEIRQAIHNFDGTSSQVIFFVPRHIVSFTPKLELGGLRSSH